jgi:hypothetical protein
MAPLLSFAQPLMRITEPMHVDLRLPKNKTFDPIAFLWPFPWLRLSGSIGFNNNMWGSNARVAQYMGYDFRVKMMFNHEKWTVLLRAQTMYVDTDASFLTGLTYQIPPHKTKKNRYKL